MTPLFVAGGEGGGLEMSEFAWEAARQQLIRLLLEQAVQYGLTTLPSGTVTDVFVDTSRVTLLGPGLSPIESLLRPLLSHDHVDAVGGPAVGAIPLVTLMAPPATGHVGRPAR
jgi:orotate phosphoribosyltransferase